MNKQTLFLVVAAALILIPTGVALRAYELDRYARLTQEGGTAYCAAFIKVSDININSPVTPPSPKPNPTPDTPPAPSGACKCGGTGFVLSGDGLQKIPCQCDKNCKCKRGTAKEVGPANRILLVTEPSYCIPCRQIEDFTLPALKKVGWTFGKNKNIDILNFEQAARLGHTPPKVPTWIVIGPDGKELRSYEGFINAGGVGRVFKGEDLNKGDDLLIDYRQKSGKVERKSLKEFARTYNGPHVGVQRNAYWHHLINEHGFSPSELQGLTQDELARVHSAAHYGFSVHWFRSTGIKPFRFPSLPGQYSKIMLARN